ncbi:hypothetical protein PLICRDRAFT_57559 [Plicaturopsis crispa FD-325 SS-3]|uniref:Unplaced genomic scaffold PLICRscaffold_17, whole genome shotgun sequence n=1 Tax=Plicaturopsis crispa FD-325 SS-3 TaxID=944288 RepID=A0A0C9SXS9_PLICR|nr:hypothetical protein PLICRDRAFT_57559 [Plicaturopsis crispa FD-325 SS-3]
MFVEELPPTGEFHSFQPSPALTATHSMEIGIVAYVHCPLRPFLPSSEAWANMQVLSRRAC